MIPTIGNRQSGKLIQERVGAPGSGGRMVSREEQPVEPKSADPTLRSPWPLPPAPSQPPPRGTASAPDTTSSDPKRIATVVIRPDGAEASERRAASPPPGTSGSAAPSQPRPAQTAARGAPLSLDPRAPASDAAAAPAPPTQRALTPPAPRIAATPPPATATAAAGGYVVQLSSQRREADAQASFRSLQEKFPSQLGDRTAIVRRTDLGAKGIYYRVVMGPFTSAGEADQFCGDLKAAGGQCIVQRN
jgi:SPOR domain